MDAVWVASRYIDGAPGCVLVGVPGGGGGEGVLLGAQLSRLARVDSLLQGRREEGGMIMNGCAHRL